MEIIYEKNFFKTFVNVNKGRAKCPNESILRSRSTTQPLIYFLTEHRSAVWKSLDGKKVQQRSSVDIHRVD